MIRHQKSVCEAPIYKSAGLIKNLRHEYRVHGDRVEFLSLIHFLNHALFGHRDLVLTYDRGGGLNFAQPAMHADFRAALSGYDSFYGTNYTQGLPRNPDGVLNLLDNAVKYGPSDQTVFVGVTRSADAALLTVKDGGPGVNPADRERIFHAFVRGRGTNGTGGAGIGLAVVRQIVEAHGALGEAQRGAWTATQAHRAIDPRVSMLEGLRFAPPALSVGPVAQGLAGRGPPSFRDP